MQHSTPTTHFSALSIDCLLLPRNHLAVEKGKFQKIEAARRKTIEVHFSGAFSLQTFIDVDLKTLPCVVAWMAKDGHGSSLLYQFVLNTTLFHDVRG